MLARRSPWFAARFALLLLLGACSPKPAHRVENAWVRPGPDGGTTAAYLELINDGAEPLVVTGVNAGFCAEAEMHETIHEGARASMQETPEVTVAARSRVRFEPGGRHLMLVELRGALAEGSRVPLSLRLASGDTLAFVADVRR